MKIGFDAKRAFHNTRGLGSYSRTLLNGLSLYHSDIDHILFTPTFKKQIKGTLSLIEKSTIIIPQSGWRLVPSYWRRKKISLLLEANEIDIYHGLSHELPIGIEKWKGKKIVTIHDLQYLHFPDFFSWIDRRTYHSKIKHACNVADVVIAICQQTKLDLMQYLEVPESKIVIHYQSCNEVFFPENRVSNPSCKTLVPYILNVGAFVANKNQLGLIKAFRAVMLEIPHNLFLVGQKGNEDYFTQIKQYITSHKLEERVHIFRDIAFDELVLKYQHADIFCFPSFFEGFGIPIIEAMFSRIPVIASNTSSLPEVGGDAAVYIDPANIEQIGAAIKKLINADDREEIIKKGLAQAQKFHLKDSTDALVKIYRS